MEYWGEYWGNKGRGAPVCPQAAWAPILAGHVGQEGRMAQASNRQTPDHVSEHEGRESSRARILAAAAPKKSTSKKIAAKKTAKKQAAAKKGAAKRAPVKKAPAKKTGVKKAPAKKAAAQQAAAKKTAAKKASAKKAPAKKSAAQRAPAKKAPVKEAPAKKARAKKAPAKALAQKAPEKAAVDKTAAKKAVVKKTAAKKGPLKKAATRPTRLVVRADEKPWTSAELAEVRGTLEAERDRLRHEIDAAQAELDELLRDSGDGSGDDQADAGSKTFEREHEMSVANNSRDLLLQVEHALVRISDGSYGTCESCGQPIGKARLQVFPRATLCVNCKQREERR